MQAAKVAGVKRVIYFSTAHVYDPSLVGGINESTLPKRPAPLSYRGSCSRGYGASRH